MISLVQWCWCSDWFGQRILRIPLDNWAQRQSEAIVWWENVQFKMNLSCQIKCCTIGEKSEFVNSYFSMHIHAQSDWANCFVRWFTTVCNLMCIRILLTKWYALYQTIGNETSNYSRQAVHSRLFTECRAWFPSVSNIYIPHLSDELPWSIYIHIMYIWFVYFEWMHILKYIHKFMWSTHPQWREK